MTVTRLVLNELEAAARLGLSHRTLQMWRVRGIGPCFLKVGRSVRYRPADVDAWLEAQVRASTSEAGSDKAA
jgi:excisionase family DNA binding protein